MRGDALCPETLYTYQLTLQNAAMPIPPLDLTFAVPATDLREAKDFLTFLRKAARKHSVTISISTNQARELSLSVPGKERWNLDLFLQELILTQGLYYYLCGVSNRRHIASAVVKPIADKGKLFLGVRLSMLAKEENLNSVAGAVGLRNVAAHADLGHLQREDLTYLETLVRYILEHLYLISAVNQKALDVEQTRKDETTKSCNEKLP